jgi:hypothetical protein
MRRGQLVGSFSQGNRLVRGMKVIGIEHGRVVQRPHVILSEAEDLFVVGERLRRMPQLPMQGGDGSRDGDRARGELLGLFQGGERGLAIMTLQAAGERDPETRLPGQRGDRSA